MPTKKFKFNKKKKKTNLQRFSNLCFDETKTAFLNLFFK